MDICPKCKTDKGYFYKNRCTVAETHSFDEKKILAGKMEVSRFGEKAHCINCERRLPDMDRENKPKEKEYWKVIADGKEQGIFPKSQKSKHRSLDNLHGIKLTTATKEEIERYGG